MTRSSDLASRIFGRQMSPGPSGIESLRCGGLPSDQGLYQTPPPTPEQQEQALRDYYWELKAARGRNEDGTWRVSAFDSGGLVSTPRRALSRKLPSCAECDVEFTFPYLLAAHRQDAHGEPIPGAPEPPACASCGEPMPLPVPGPTQRYCSALCYMAARQGAAGEDAAG